jgi:hypothetical protein
MDGCALLDLTCHATAVGTAAIDLFPFGLYGLIFFAGMIVGERIGVWGIVIAVVGWLAIRFGKKTPDVHEHVAGRDAAPPVPVKKKRKTLF